MKILLMISVVVFFGVVGLNIKCKYKMQYSLYITLKDYINFLDANISLFKDNLLGINNNYKIMQKNKNAKYNYFLSNSSSKHLFNLKYINNIVFSNEDYYIIENFLNRLGEGDFCFEKEKISQFGNFLNEKIIKSKELIKLKGDLYFKLLLAIGIVISILMW